MNKLDQLTKIQEVFNNRKSTICDLFAVSEGFSEIHPSDLPDSDISKLFHFDISSNSLYSSRLIDRVKKVVDLGVPVETNLQKCLGACYYPYSHFLLINAELLANLRDLCGE